MPEDAYPYSGWSHGNSPANAVEGVLAHADCRFVIGDDDASKLTLGQTMYQRAALRSAPLFRRRL
jgi:hypothetical protein